MDKRSVRILTSPQPKREVNYAESSDEDQDVATSMRTSQARRRNKVRSSIVQDDDEYDDATILPEDDDDEMADLSCPTIQMIPRHPRRESEDRPKSQPQESAPRHLLKSKTTKTRKMR